MYIITAQQSRDARRELGLSQADITNALGFTRQYISEFETGFSTRLTTAQLKKLRAFYEDKIKVANENGESISVDFGEIEKLPLISHISTPQAAAPYRFLPVYLDVDQPSVIKTQSVIQDNDARLAVLMQQEALRDDGFLGSGEFIEETQESLQEVFALMAVNYALWRSLSGWPALGLSPSTEDAMTIRDVVFKSFGDQFEIAGLFVNPPDKEKINVNEGEGE